MDFTVKSTVMEEGSPFDPLLPCPFCGGEVRWCGEGANSCGDEECPHIHCDKCDMHFDNSGQAIMRANTVRGARRVMAMIWNNRNRKETD